MPKMTLEQKAWQSLLNQLREKKKQKMARMADVKLKAQHYNDWYDHYCAASDELDMVNPEMVEVIGGWKNSIGRFDSGL